MDSKRFNLRVYGILMRDGTDILVSDEVIRGQNITKFPGGGLEFGEGTIDCLVREFREELDISIEVEEHLYTTDFYQPSAFRQSEQVVSIYYRVFTNEISSIPITKVPFALSEPENGSQSFRWIAISELKVEDLTLPIDKKVAAILSAQLSG